MPHSSRKIKGNRRKKERNGETEGQREEGRVDDGVNSSGGDSKSESVGS